MRFSTYKNWNLYVRYLQPLSMIKVNDHSLCINLSKNVTIYYVADIILQILI